MTSNNNNPPYPNNNHQPIFPDGNVAPVIGADAPTEMNEADKIRLRELREKARRDIGEAILLIPMERKSAYLEAIEKAPYLFQDESDPLKFLRREGYNIGNTAERLCLYWEERKDLFGPDRAFLPMVATGDGALSKDDCLSLQAGFPALLPEKTVAGLQVLYLDRRQHVPSLTRENRLRGIFYVSGYLVQDELAQTDGVVAVFMLLTSRIHAVDWAFVEKVIYYTTKVFPMKVKIWHLINVPPKVKSHMRKQYFVQDLITSFTGAIAKMGQSVMDDVEVHFEREGGEILNFFRNRLGLSLSSVPHDLGGSWNFVETTNRWRKQALYEADRYKFILQLARRKRLAATSSSAASTTTDVSEDAKAPPGDAEADKSAKRRAANVFKARRKRERDRQEKANLESERDLLLREQNSLKAKQEHLLASLKQARDLVNRHCMDESLTGKKIPPAHKESFATCGSTSGSMSGSSDSG